MPVTPEVIIPVVLSSIAGVVKPIWDMQQTAFGGEKRVLLAKALGEACRQEPYDVGVIREAFEGLFGLQPQLSIQEIRFLVNHTDDYVLRLREFLRHRDTLSFQLDPPAAVWASPTAQRIAWAEKWLYRLLTGMILIILVATVAATILGPDNGSRVAIFLFMAVLSIAIGALGAKASIAAKADAVRSAFSDYFRFPNNLSNDGKPHSLFVDSVGPTGSGQDLIEGTPSVEG